MSIIGSCGCKLADSDGEHGLGFSVLVQYEGCDAATGFYRAISYMSVCAKCKEKYKEWDMLFETEEEAHEWMLADPHNQREDQ